MQPALPQGSTCPNCGSVLEKTPSGELSCMSCLLRAGIGSEEETVHHSTPDALEGGLRFGVYEVDRREDGSLYELGRGAMTNPGGAAKAQEGPALEMNPGVSREPQKAKSK